MSWCWTEMYSLAIVNNTVIHVFVHIIILSDTPTRMAKIQTLTTANADEGVEQQELSFTAGGNAKCTNTLAGSVMVSYKTKHTLMIQQLFSFMFTPRSRELCAYKNLPTDVYSSFIYNWQNWEATEISFTRWVDKWTVVQPGNRGLVNNKYQWTIKPWKDMN